MLLATDYNRDFYIAIFWRTRVKYMSRKSAFAVLPCCEEEEEVMESSELVDNDLPLLAVELRRGRKIQIHQKLHAQRRLRRSRGREISILHKRACVQQKMW